jgi:hypothetical protein
MPFTRQIEQARTAHALLRQNSKPFDSNNAKLAQLQQIRSALDQIWPASEEHPQGAHIRQCIRRLRADAELHSGVAETEVFRDDESVWQEYDFLKGMFAESPKS